MGSTQLSVVGDAPADTMFVRWARRVAVVVLFAVCAAALWFWRPYGSGADPLREAAIRSVGVEAAALPAEGDRLVLNQRVVGRYVGEVDCRSIVATSSAAPAAAADAWFRRLLARGWVLNVTYNASQSGNEAIRALDPVRSRGMRAGFENTLVVDKTSYAGGVWELPNKLTGALNVAGPGAYSFHGCDDGPVRSHVVQPGQSIAEFNLTSQWAR